MSTKSEKKKDKKKKKSEEKSEREDENSLSKLDILELVEDLKMQKQNLITINNYEEATQKSIEIIDLAKKYEMFSLVTEEEDFIKKAKEEINKERKKLEFTGRLKNVIDGYHSLISKNNIESAHRLIEDFSKFCEKNPEFAELPEVNDLIMKDAKIWITYITEKQLKKEDAEFEKKEISKEKNLEEKLKIRKEIKESAELANFFFKKLIAENNIEKAHKFVMDFVEKYEDYPFFSSIPEVETLLKEEAKTWINYITEKQIIEDSTQIRESSVLEEKGEKSNLILEIEQNCQALDSMFDKLVFAGNLEEAKGIIRNFENHYKNKINLKSIPSVQKLFLKRDSLMNKK